MKNKAFCILFISLLFPALSFGMPLMPPPMEGMPPMQMMRGDMQHDDLIEKLDLKKDVQTDIKKLMLDHQTKENTLRAQLQNSFLKLQDELSNDQSDKTKINVYKAEINKVQADMLDDKINHLLAIKALLTPEQQKKLAQLHKKQMEKMMCSFKEKKQKRAKK